MGHILRMNPVFKEMIWGGTKLKDIYGRLPKEVEKILLKRKIDILASSSNIESVYEDNMINIILTKEISLTNGVATILSNKLSVIKDDIFVRVIDKKFIIKIQKNKESQNNLLYILEVICIYIHAHKITIMHVIISLFLLRIIIYIFNIVNRKMEIIL